MKIITSITKKKNKGKRKEKKKRSQHISDEGRKK